MHRESHVPTEKEIQILKDATIRYFCHPKRSRERKEIVETATNKLNEINQYWNQALTRLWFNNNKLDYKDEIEAAGGSVEVSYEMSNYPKIISPEPPKLP